MKSMLTVLLLLTPLAAKGQQQSDRHDPELGYVPAQPERLVSNIPRAYVEFGPSINACGYTNLSVQGDAGIDLESGRLLWKSAVSYNTARKENDGTTANNSGHSAGTSSVAFVRLGEGWFLGGGVGWSKTITFNYTKQATYPKIGFGKDFSKYRLQFMYLREENEITHYPSALKFTPGPGQAAVSSTCHCGSGVSGVEAHLWYPSPALKRHVFFHAVFQPFIFHATITDPYNASLTAAQKANHAFTGTLKYSILYRF
jgi:hypothetical protein